MVSWSPANNCPPLRAPSFARTLLTFIKEFSEFVKETEHQLYALFKSIDHDKNGKLDKGELQAAFLRSGLLVTQSKLDQFFAKVDTNSDGVITFDEWRCVSFEFNRGASIHVPYRFPPLR